MVKRVVRLGGAGVVAREPVVEPRPKRTEVVKQSAQGRMVPSRPEHLPTDEELQQALTPGIPDLATTIRTSNDLVRAHYALSLNATRVLAYAIAYIDADTVKKNGQFPLLKIPLTHIAETFPSLASSKSIYADIAAAAEELFDAQVSFPVPNSRSGDKVRLRWAPTCGKVGGYLLLRLNFDLAPYLLDLKERYTARQLMYVVELRSPYHWRLYEIFRSYLWRGGCELLVEDAKAMLEIDPDQYKQVGHFKARILLPALKAIEDVTDMIVSIKREVREGKKILGWDFEIRRQAQRKLILNPQAAPLIERMMRLGIPVKRAQSFAQDYEPDYLAKQLDFMTEKGSSGYAIQEPAAFLHASLEGDYAGEQAEGLLREAAAESERTAKALHQEAEKRLRAAKDTAARMAPIDWRRDKALALYEEMSERKKKEVTAAFADSLTHSPRSAHVLAGFNANGLENPWARGEFRSYLVKHFEIGEPAPDELREYIASHWEAYAPRE